MPRDSRQHERGQILPLFAVSVFVLTAVIAIVVDVSWWWSNSLKVQRAADAAALAGVVYLPGNPAAAFNSARAEATKNGYTDGLGSVVVTPVQDPTNSRRLLVTITTPVSTYFARVVGMNQINVTQTARAEYALPVPMGSPLNYLGVFVIRAPAHSDLGDSGARVATTTPTGNWTASGGSVVDAVNSSNAVFAQALTDGLTQQFGSFGFTAGTTPPIPNPASGETLTITGLQVVLTNANVDAACANSSISADLSWDGGASWSTVSTGALTTTDQTFSLGSATSTSAWGSHGWVGNDFSDTNFQVGLTAVKGCATAALVRLDELQVIVSYRLDVPADMVGKPVKSSDGATDLASQGFWATIGSQGMDKINGDAFSPKWNPRTSATNSEYLPTQYYDYIVELSPGSTNGSVWLFDAPFCATAGSGLFGAGDRWFGSNNAMSTFYTLYDSRGTLTDFGDDTLLADSNSLFRSMRASDAKLGGATGSGIADCSAGATSSTADGRYWHNRWWQLGSGLTAGTTPRMLRLHVSTTDSASPNDQNNADGHNSFSVEARATGGTPKVYGMGTMQNFYPLQGAAASEFYLAQIDAVHAGKTMMLELYDPGDTGVLRADLQILQPTSSGYTPATFSYTARQAAGSSSVSSCNTNTGTNVTSVTSNSGSSSKFNGCWLTITIPLSTTYSAPIPPGIPGPGWWKIRYVMSGNTTDNAFDLVTLKVSLRGSPVHLVTQ